MKSEPNHVEATENGLISSFLEGKRIVVTGGVGTVGGDLVRQLARYKPAVIRVVDNNESGLFYLEQEFSGDRRMEFFHCDIASMSGLRATFSRMDYCLHVAALKHVPSCERSPGSAVQTNIIGVNNVIRAAQYENLQKVLFTSSDKAVNPTNVMGTSKLMGERLFTAANGLRGGGPGTIFSSTRFGNVAGSNGSVIPLFCRQIASGAPVTITDVRMSRFIMTRQMASDLVLESMVYAQGGEVLITKMPALRVIDLAHVMIDLIAPLHGYKPSDIELKVIGARPGEKLWEELSTDEESRRILEGDRYLIVLPAGTAAEDIDLSAYAALGAQPSDTIYHSDQLEKMSYGEIAAFLLQPGVLPDDIRTQLEAQSQVLEAPSRIAV